MDLPLYCIIGNRPVKAIETESGGMEVVALNWKNGNFERDMKYLDLTFRRVRSNFLDF